MLYQWSPLEEARRFLHLLEPDKTAPLTFQTFDDAGQDRPLARVLTTRKSADLLQAHAQGAGVYITVNRTDGTGRCSENIQRIRAVWQEDDGQHGGPFPLEPSIVVESSPGHFHRYWLCSDAWPADEGGRADFAGVMERMVESYGSDKNAKDISRVLRVPGFLHRKDPTTPHAVRIVSEGGRRYTRAEIIAAFPPVIREQKTNGHTEWEPRGDDEERIRDALRHIPADDRGMWLQIGMALKDHLGDGGRSLWDSWSATCTQKFSDRDQTVTWRSFRKNGIGIGTLFFHAQQAGWRPQRARENVVQFTQPSAPIIAARTTSQAAPEPVKEAVALQCAPASSYEMRAIKWLWPNRFALGKFGLIVGLPDEGKGQLTYDIAARCTRPDSAWPCGEGQAPFGNVILLTAEDDIGDTVVPRLVAAVADLDRVHIIKMVRHENKERMFSIVSDLPLLRQKMLEIGNVVLVLIDPISAYLGVGKVNSFRTTDVRAVLAPLTDLAAEMVAAFIAVMHFNKKTDVTNALLRISDSLAFGATARHVYAAIDDEENKRKLFVKGKNNLAPKDMAKTLAYGFGAREVGHDAQTGEVIWAPYIVWHPHHVDVTASEAMEAASASRSPGARDSAKKFLADLLRHGPVLQTEVDEAATAHCISQATLRRAREDMGVIVEKEKGVLKGKWFWRLPPSHSGGDRRND